MRQTKMISILAASFLAFSSAGLSAQEQDGAFARQRHFEKMCAENSPKSDDKMPDRLAKFLLLSDQQSSLLREVHETFLKSMTEGKSLCTAKMDFQTVPGRMAFDQAILEARLSGAKQVRTKMDAFYGSLNDQQRAKFDLGYNRNQRNWRHRDDG